MFTAWLICAGFAVELLASSGIVLGKKHTQGPPSRGSPRKLCPGSLCGGEWKLVQKLVSTGVELEWRW